MQRLDAGFSLIELLVTVTLFSIVMTLSIGGYTRYLQRANRADATGALLRMAAAQERYYIANGRYAENPGELGFARTSERGYYTLNIEAEDAVIGYRASARTNPDNRQRDDRDCRTLTIDQSGLRGAQGEPETDADPAKCWR